jgi:hypothetical protein
VNFGFLKFTVKFTSTSGRSFDSPAGHPRQEGSPDKCERTSGIPQDFGSGLSTPTSVTAALVGDPGRPPPGSAHAR